MPVEKAKYWFVLVGKAEDMTNENLVPLRELPKSLLNDISLRLISHTTAIIPIGIDKKTGHDDFGPIGSGTFIAMEDKIGILTAAHVAEEIKGKSLGLTLYRSEHRYEISHDSVEITIVDNGKFGSEGPDLAYINLPIALRGTIEASEKTFYNIKTRRTQMLNSPPEPDNGIWVVCGVPHKKTIEETSQKFIDGVKGFAILCGFGGIRQPETQGVHDYLYYDVDYNSSNEIPDSFGGVSGGGVWQITLYKDPDGQIKPKQYLLSGVAFYQTARDGQTCSIKCHGRKSIYDFAYAKLTQSS